MSISAPNEDKGYKLENRIDILPYPFSRGSAVWVEDSIYMFGGRNETDKLDRIMKYTPANDQLIFLDTRLPEVLMGTTAVYDGNYVYIFGGWDYNDFHNFILRFDPKTEILTNMTARLPKPTVGAAGVWTGQYIFIIGGCWGAMEPEKYDTIVRYDPQQDNITIMNSTLTYGRSGVAATWDGEFIYIVGGSNEKNYSAKVFKYSPKEDLIKLLPGTLPSGRQHIKVEYYNNSLYIFGGSVSHTKVTNQILRYDLKTDDVLILEQTLPTPCEFRMHAFDGKNIYLIGGFDGPVNINQIIIFTPEVEPNGHSDHKVSSRSISDNLILLVTLVIFIIIILIKFYKILPTPK